MQSQIYSYPLTIKEMYLDTFGHVNNAMYLTLLEEARWEWVTSNGYGIQRIKELQQGPTVLEIRIKFLKELKLRDQVIIDSQIMSYEKKIGIMQQTIRRNNDLCCTAEFVIALFDLKLRQLIEPTPAWLKAVGLGE